MRAAALLALPLVLAGCVSSPEGPGGPGSPDPSASADDPWGGTRNQTLVDAENNLSVEFDALCLLGGGPELPRRPDTRVLPGTDRLDLGVEIEPGTTGIQLGYALDDGPVTWLGPPMSGGRAEWTVRVEPDQVEQTGQPARWAFFSQMNLPGGPVDCYTGGGVGRYHVVIEALRGAVAPSGGSPASWP